MKVRILGNGNRWRIVAASDNSRVLGFDSNYSGCLLIAGQRGWQVIR